MPANARTRPVAIQEAAARPHRPSAANSPLSAAAGSVGARRRSRNRSPRTKTAPRPTPRVRTCRADTSAGNTIDAPDNESEQELPQADLVHRAIGSLPPRLVLLVRLSRGAYPQRTAEVVMKA